MTLSFKRTALLLTVPTGLLAIALYVVPIVQVLAISVTEPSFGLQNYARLFSSRAIARVVRTTLAVSLYTTVITVAASYLVAFAILHMRETMRRVALFLVLVPFWISVLVRAFAWITILRRQGLVNSGLVETGLIGAPLDLVYNTFGVTVGMVHYMMPFAILLLYANLSDIDRRIVQAARSLGARPATVFWRVWLPLSLPGLALTALFVFVFSLGFLVTPALLGAGKTLMVAEYISIQITSTARWDVATALATMLLLTVGLLIFLVLRVPLLRSAFVARQAG